MMNAKNYSLGLLDFLNNHPTPFHVVEGGREMLRAAGFEELRMEDSWQIKPGGKYFTTRNDSALIAFIAGTGDPGVHGYRMIGAHTDAPAIRIKNNPEITGAKKYLTLNVEMYGGLIYSTWLDRPLGIAGRVALASKDPFKPEMRLVNIKRPVAIIPNMAIHVNREINTGYQYNPQVDLLPLLGITNSEGEASDWFMDFLAAETGVEKEDVLGCDLYLYDLQAGTLGGMKEEFIHVGRLDDVAMTYVAWKALSESESQEATLIAAGYDNEEIGSLTKQGAASSWTRHILRRIQNALGDADDGRMPYRSFFISCDMSHAVHPQFPAKHDPTNHPYINGGPVIKYHYGQKYATDAESAAVFKRVCKEADVKYQEFHNRSDSRGGGTIGPIISAGLDVRGLDIGNPTLAMHSIRELGGVEDMYALHKVFTTFYRLK